MKKYELIYDDAIMVNTREVYTIAYRIRALKDFGNIKEGELGGYIESEKNLSQCGNCWVSVRSVVTGNATIGDDAWVTEKAFIAGNAQVIENAEIGGNARISGNAIIYGKVLVNGNAVVSDNAVVYENAMIYDHARVRGNACVYGNSKLRDNVLVAENVHICGNAEIKSDARVRGNVIITGNALITSESDYATIGGFGSVHRDTAFFRLADGSIGVQCGCFYGTLDEFRKKVVETHGNTKYAREYLIIADLMENHFKED